METRFKLYENLILKSTFLLTSLRFYEGNTFLFLLKRVEFTFNGLLSQHMRNEQFRIGTVYLCNDKYVSVFQLHFISKGIILAQSLTHTHTHIHTHTHTHIYIYIYIYTAKTVAILPRLSSNDSAKVTYTFGIGSS